MRFSDIASIVRTVDDDWFDPVLQADTQLFVDPFLIFEDKDSRWVGTHAKVVRFFNEALKLIAQSRANPASNAGAKVQNMLLFPEPDEFCLGYGEATTRGSGSGGQLRNAIMRSATETIARGVESVDHFEELAIFGEGLGPDRISDIVCNILKEEFIAYTKDVCARHGAVTQSVRVRNALWSEEHLRWSPKSEELPLNPTNQRPILLVPQRFLRELPTLDPWEFWEYMWTNEGEQLRADFNYDLARHVDRATITAYARRRPGAVQGFVRYREANPTSAYNVDGDPKFLFAAELATKVANRIVLPAEVGEDEFCDWILELVNNFRHEVEEGGIWRALWVDDTPRDERQVQLLFKLASGRLCEVSDVDLTKESDTGSGPVDFKLSRGASKRGHVEFKLAKSASLKRNLEHQLPSYMTSEEIDCGYFVVVQYRDDECDAEVRDSLQEIVDKVLTERGIKIRLVFVDARKKPSASKR